MSTPPPLPISSIEAIEALPKRAADRRLAYGNDPHQFGDLWLPAVSGAPAAVAVFLHGGCWLAKRTLDYAASFCGALADHGFAVWCPEYRRIGNPGGGFPGTFEDAGAAVDFVARIAAEFPIDRSRVVLMGHSAGGHLALWAAARHRIDGGSPLAAKAPLAVGGVISLAGITDLEAYIGVGNACSQSVEPLMGGLPDGVPDRYAAGNPLRLLPTGIAVRLIHGDADAIVPLDQPQRYLNAATRAGDDCQLKVFKGDGHFEVVAPGTAAFEAVVGATGELTSAAI